MTASTAGDSAGSRAERSAEAVGQSAQTISRLSYTKEFAVPILPGHAEQPVTADIVGPGLSIIMAAYNEERSIMRAVEAVLATDYPCDIELIIVDDGSTDRTPELLAGITDPRVVVCRHEANRGKGAALLSATAIARGTYIVPFDADLEYSPEDIERMLDPVIKGRSLVVYGSRLFGFNTAYPSWGFALGNRILTRFANILYNACLSDLHTCLKLMPTDLLRSLPLHESGFGLDSEITASLLRAGVRPFEVPVSYVGRSRAQGKKINWRDGVACVWILLRVRLRRASSPLLEDLDPGYGRYPRPRSLTATDRQEPQVNGRPMLVHGSDTECASAVAG